MVTIIDSRDKKRVFGGLFLGDCFMFEGELYMVTEDTIAKENVCDNYYDSDVLNALNLTNGLLKRFGGQEVVETVDIQITIS